MTAKKICPRHEIAHFATESCPYCEPPASPAAECGGISVSIGGIQFTGFDSNEFFDDPEEDTQPMYTLSTSAGRTYYEHITAGSRIAPPWDTLTIERKLSWQNWARTAGFA